MSTVPPNNFEINIVNILNPDEDGIANATLTPQLLRIPPNFSYGGINAPTDLQSLADLVGPDNITIKYYAKPNGSDSGHGCKATWTLLAGVATTDGKSYSAPIAQTDDAPNQSTSYDSNPYVLIGTSNYSARTVSSWDDGGKGSGDGCRFGSKGGWSQVKISLKISVLVDFSSYCLTGDMIYSSDMCYDYMGQYFGSGNATMQMTDYVQGYCSDTFPDDDLNVFTDGTADTRNTQICACNMDSGDYIAFVDSAAEQIQGNFASIDPPCVFPACNSSNFQPAALEGCPVPSCLNFTSLDGNDIDGQVNINQTADCQSTFSPISFDQDSSGNNPGTNPPNPPNAPNPPDSSDSDSNAMLWIIIFVVIIFIIIMGSGALLLMKSAQSKK